MHADPDIQALAEAGRFDEIEGLWLQHVESTPDDAPYFLAALRTLLDAGQETRAATLVDFLLDAHRERGAGMAELAFVKPALAVWPSSPELRAACFDAVQRAYATRPSFERLVQHFRFAEASDPLGALGRLENWLRFDVGTPVLMTGRGLGQVAEINPALGSLRVELPGGQRMTLKLAEAEKLLQALEPGHILVEKTQRPGELAALAESDPGELLSKLFASAAGPLGISEIKETLSGIVPDERWATWWKRASSDARLATSGGKRPTYSWSASGEAAEEGVRQAFEAASPRDQMELARKHADRSPALARFFRSHLAGVVRATRTEEPSLALEAALTIEKLAGGAPSAERENPRTVTPSAAELLDVEDPVPVVAGVVERGVRERAIALLRERRADWRTLYARLLRAETDTRTLAVLYDSLSHEGGEESLAATVDDVFARPHTAPRLFVWLCRELRRRPELERRGDWALLKRLLDAHTLEAFRGLRAPLRELFDDGGIGEHLAAKLDRDQAEQLHAILTRDLGLDEHRKDHMRHAILRRHPELRETEEEVLYTTTAGLERKRAEFESITKVEIPRNAEEIRKAAAHGDLRENFEYKAAREKHEMLSSRAKTLHDELRRAKALDPAAIDPSCVRVGTRVRLDPVTPGEPRTLVILGPWDSDPARGVVSYLAPAIQPLLGRRIGDSVSFLDGDWVVGAIELWQPT